MATNPFAYLQAADFEESLIALLPPGAAWEGPGVAGLMAGCAEGFGDLHARAAVLSEIETVPSITAELLTAWESDWGLPDTCTPLGATLQQRRAALLAKIQAIGGQSIAYFVGVAAALGFAITVTEGAVGSFAWTVHAPSASQVYFRAGASSAGDHLSYHATNAQLECVLNRIKPAHTVLNFAYDLPPAGAVFMRGH